MHNDHRQPRDVSRRNLLTKAAVVAPLAAVGGALRPVAAFVPTAGAAELSDLDLMAFAQTIELGLVGVYQAATATGKLGADATALVGQFLAHHQTHADTFASVLTVAKAEAPGVANDALVAEFRPRVQSAGSEAALLGVALDLEDAAAATHQYLLGVLQANGPASQVAQVLAVEAEHAVAASTLLKKAAADYLPAQQTTDGYLAPATYPVPTSTTTTVAPSTSGASS